jgi:hypothetical protein
MLVLQILSAALIISLAKANPVAVDVRNWENPAADGAFEREELIVASPASHYSPGPTETSLTLRYHQERATCLDQFVWYCQIPAGACIATVGTIVRILFYTTFIIAQRSYLGPACQSVGSFTLRHRRCLCIGM